MVGPARQPFGAVGSLERLRTHQAGPIARWAPSAIRACHGSSGEIQQDPSDPPGKEAAVAASATKADDGLRTVTRTRSFGNTQGRPCQIEPTRTLFVPSGTEAARRVSANRAATEGPSGPSGPSQCLRAAAGARSLRRSASEASSRLRAKGAVPDRPRPDRNCTGDLRTTHPGRRLRALVRSVSSRTQAASRGGQGRLRSSDKSRAGTAVSSDIAATAANGIGPSLRARSATAALRR